MITGNMMTKKKLPIGDHYIPTLLSLFPHVKVAQLIPSINISVYSIKHIYSNNSLPDTLYSVQFLFIYVRALGE